MVGLSQFWVLGVLLLASPALQEAQECYESLDYVCADQQLALALRSELSSESRIVAQKLDVLIAFAWRDEKRIVAAAKRLFDTSPRLELSGFPKDLIERIEPYRPAPPKPSSIATQLSYRLKLLAPSSLDASQWLPGEGVRIDLGYFNQQRVLLGLYTEAIQHYAKSEFSYDTLSVYEFGLTWRQAFQWRRFWLFLGGQLGFSAQEAHVDPGYEALIGDESELKFGVSSGVMGEACFEFWRASLFCLNGGTSLLVRQSGGQPSTSYLFPLGLGLRYDYQLDD
ncbi:MAG: hypothetical protein ACPGQS_02390 [Bradymonadia bacterium]